MASFFPVCFKPKTMDKEKKNRSGSLSNPRKDQDSKNERKQTSQPGAPSKSNRQTGGQRKDESHGSDRNDNKKGQNAI
jgi:hypothetical protein